MSLYAWLTSLDALSNAPNSKSNAAVCQKTISPPYHMIHQQRDSEARTFADHVKREPREPLVHHDRAALRRVRQDLVLPLLAHLQRRSARYVKHSFTSDAN